MAITNKEIVDISKGNVKAFKLFFEAFYRPLCQFCYELVKDYDQAAEIAQETMVRFWDSREKHTHIKQAKVYLFTIARNLSLNHIRKTKKFRTASLDQKESSLVFMNVLLREELFDYLYEAIETLPSRTREVIELTLKGYSNNEIASEMNVTVNTVKTLKKSAYKKLRESSLKHIYLPLFAF